MQFKTPALLICLLPVPALAYGDMDCITLETCGAGGCIAETRPFSVVFDWTVPTATVTVDGMSHRLNLRDLGENGPAGQPTYVEFGAMDAAPEKLLWVDVIGTTINAYWTFKDPGVVTWTATCEEKQAT